MALSENLVACAKYYEKRVRQYNELSDFLQALEFDHVEPFGDYFYSNRDSLNFDNCNELVITTPAILESKKTRQELFYSVNLVKDLDWTVANLRITMILIKEIQDSMKKIEDELAAVFDGIEVSEE